MKPSSHYPLGQYLQEPVSEQAVARMWQKIDIGEHQRGRSRMPLYGAALAIVVTMLAAMTAHWAWPSPDALTWGDGGQAVVPQTVVSRGSQRILRFDENSTISLDKESELAIVSSSPTSFVTSLRSGRARFSITPGGPRRWVVDAGNVNVEVVGTIFTVERSPNGTRVSVERGVVMVRGAITGGERRLTAGQSVLGRAEGAAKSAHASQKASSRKESEESAELLPVQLSSLQVVDEGQGLVSDQEQPRTAQVVVHKMGQEDTRTGAKNPADAQPSVDELLSQADSAKRKGQVAQALKLLNSAVVESAPGDPRRGMAALSYVRLSSDPSAIKRVLALGLDSMPSNLREPALARLVRAHQELGELKQAQMAAYQYLAEFPKGPRAAQVRNWAALP